MNAMKLHAGSKWYSKHHSRRTGYLKYRPMYVEPLEDRCMMSAFSPFQAAADGSSVSAQKLAGGAGDLVSPTAVYAPETTGVPMTVSIGGTASPENAAVTQTGGPVTLITSESAATLNPEEWFEAGGIPEQLSIGGIPPGDAGGVAGGDGGGRLPLEIPGFSGYGNAYFLDNANDSLARIVWLYAEYFGNQQRVVPLTTDLPRPRMNDAWNRYGLFGSSLGGTVFYDENPQAPVEKKEKAVPKEVLPQKPEREMEHHLDTEMEKTLQDLIRQKQYFEQKRTPEPYELEQPVLPPNAPLPRQSAPEQRLKPGIPEAEPGTPSQKGEKPDIRENPSALPDWEQELKDLQEELERSPIGDGITEEDLNRLSESVAALPWNLNRRTDFPGIVLQNAEEGKNEKERPTREVISETLPKNETLYEAPSREMAVSNRNAASGVKNAS